jgi:hypothetical protein
MYNIRQELNTVLELRETSWILSQNSINFILNKDNISVFT